VIRRASQSCFALGKGSGIVLLLVMKPGSICHRITEIAGLAGIFQTSSDLLSALSRARAMASQARSSLEIVDAAPVDRRVPATIHLRA